MVFGVSFEGAVSLDIADPGYRTLSPPNANSPQPSSSSSEKRRDRPSVLSPPFQARSSRSARLHPAFLFYYIERTNELHKGRRVHCTESHGGPVNAVNLCLQECFAPPSWITSLCQSLRGYLFHFSLLRKIIGPLENFFFPHRTQLSWIF